MRVCGIICEYDPFHRGHAEHIARARALSGADYVLCLMSGAFTQRGMPALLPARARAEMALLGGADAVLCAPYACSVREAEHFALGFAAILDSLKIVTHLSFGTETSDFSLLSEAAALLERPDEAYQAALRAALDRGFSFAEASGRALERALGSRARALRSPNAVLALSYYRALSRLQSAMQPVPVVRAGDYHDERAGAFSASAARGAFLRGDWATLRRVVPEACYPVLEQAILRGGVCRPEALDAPLRAKLSAMSPEAFAALPEIGEGLENRIIAAARAETTRESIIQAVKTRRYPYARISRALCHALVGATETELSAPPGYARVLGFRASAAPLMRALKKSGFALITRPARDIDREAYALDARADDMRHVLAGESCGAEYRETPIILE